MTTPAHDTPIFDITRHFDAVVTIGAQTVPIRIARFTRATWLEFRKQWDDLIATRPLADLTPAQLEERQDRQLAFMEKTIVDNITLDEGLIRVNGEWVTTGAGLIDVFFSRADVLTTLVSEVMKQNTLQPLLAKNSNSPRVSATGSEASIPTRGGDGQGPTAPSAAISTSASPAPAPAGPASSEASPSSSGATPNGGERSVH